MKLYLAGPMRGIPDFNFPMFNKVADILRRKGHEVFNPAEKDLERHGGVAIGNPTGDEHQAAKEHNFSLRQALLDDMTFICSHAEGIVMLPGWEGSSGAMAEWMLARALCSTYPFKFVYVTSISNTLLHVPIEPAQIEEAA